MSDAPIPIASAQNTGGAVRIAWLSPNALRLRSTDTRTPKPATERTPRSPDDPVKDRKENRPD
jgi:hypothetical protein